LFRCRANDEPRATQLTRVNTIDPASRYN